MALFVFILVGGLVPTYIDSMNEVSCIRTNICLLCSFLKWPGGQAIYITTLCHLFC